MPSALFELSLAKQQQVSLSPKNQSREDGSYKRNNPVLLMANGKTIRESFAKTELGFLGIKVFSSVLQLDVTHIEKKVRVLFAVARFSLFVLLVLRFFLFFLLLRFV
jgi:hypothetical protein